MNAIKGFTPGPWEVDFGNDGAVVYKLDQATIASIPTDFGCHQENARLIASAPTMYAELATLRAERDMLAQTLDVLCGNAIVSAEIGEYEARERFAQIRHVVRAALAKVSK